MKMKTFWKNLFVALAIGIVPVAFAEENENATGDAEPVMAQGDLSNVMSDYVNAHQDVLDPNKCKVFLGVADISVKAGKKGHALSRVIAYHKAFLTARQEFAKWLETEVTSSMQSMASEGSGLGKAESSVHSLVNDALTETMKTQAAAKGIDVNDPAAFSKFVKENVVGSSNFKQQIGAAGSSFQQGLMAYKSFANGEQVGVIAVFNQRNMSVAKALRTGTDNGIRGKAKTTILSQLPKDAKTLANTFGARILRDENGQYCVIGYGHGVAASKSSMSKNNAKKKAALQAINEIKTFAGEQIVFSEAQEVAEAGGELADGTSVAGNSEKFESNVQQKASTLKINGSKTVVCNVILLPSGETIAVSVAMWNPGEALKAKKTAGEMLVGKDQKNQGIQAGTAAAKRNSASETDGLHRSKVSGTDLKAKATVGESDVSDLD